MEILYNDIDPSSPRKPELETGMIPHALAALESPAGPQAWAEKAFDGRRGYVRTLVDQTNPVATQDVWMEKSGVEWDVVTLDAGHCAFISQPKELARVCFGFFEKWR
ncbi:hypothetical protein BU23DRAFT_461518 [Bimuria novae-zelandiae CBS 107.79]|uniref:AB hydrolase-1 domain-containing protein n=1 Tax=Bimuria novae-zelandiae CBS 107.79 TaxID=1447943 RepID=A0A6A5VAY9_9PLEO|nr:hypothetical protein BU23DRAFT_461518 [Bimuria novae-zelandiae CBS 107.79]